MLNKLGTAIKPMQSHKEGLSGQLSGLVIQVKDSKGKLKPKITALLNNFVEVYRAQDSLENHAISLAAGSDVSKTVKAGFSDLRARALSLRGGDGATVQYYDPLSKEPYHKAVISNMLKNAIRKCDMAMEDNDRYCREYIEKAVD